MNLCILGSTGSIGTKTLEIAKRYPDHIHVSSLVAGRNLELLAKQVREHRPKVVVLKRKEDTRPFRELIGPGFDGEILAGEEGYEAAVSLPEVDVVVSAISGTAGLYPSYLALRHGKNLALANKESLVMAGKILTELSTKKGSWIRPVDSEHSGVFQAMEGHKKEEIHRIILTASGGPFKGIPQRELVKVKKEDALRHPNWKMGPKITVDSATLMNKGLEVMEAIWLFGLELSKVEILIHPQSLVHALVEYVDGSILAQVSVPDMSIPIAYALFYPEHKDIVKRGIVRSLDLESLNGLTFERPDLSLYPCLKIALDVAKEGRSFPVVLNAANDEAVDAFLEGKIGFVEIPQILLSVLDTHEPQDIEDIEQVLSIESWARAKTREYILSRGGI
ncbi:MAG: 1-deoxy-D-xylulose-5-phosphate reductoisomerase [Desulfatiglandales bacterium]